MRFANRVHSVGNPTIDAPDIVQGCVLVQGVVLPMFTGVLLGYLSYDCIHYALHHAHLKEGWLGKLKRRHLDHHFRHPEATFGISSAVFDVLLHSMPRGVAK